MTKIEQMKKEYEQKMKYAQLEDEMESRFDAEFLKKVRFGVMGEDSTQKGKIFCHFVGNERYIDKATAARILKELPATEKTKTKGPGGQEDIEMNYVLSTFRYPTESFTNLRFEWIWENYYIWMQLPLIPGDEVTENYFRRDSYEIDNSEIGLWYGAVSPKQKSALRTQSVLSFNCGRQIRYQGGKFKQISEGLADCIVYDIIGL